MQIYYVTWTIFNKLFKFIFKGTNIYIEDFWQIDVFYYLQNLINKLIIKRITNEYFEV